MTLNNLKGHIPDSILEKIPEVMEKFQINTPARLAHFLAQTGHESGGFKVFQENLNYSAKGLTGIFKKYFKRADGTVDEPKALAYAKKPEKIANLVYGGRMGNGPEASGDGYKFRGRGAIQLTGKDNYTAFFKSIGLGPDADPNLVGTQYALLSAAWFWSKNGLNKISDEGATDAVVTKITKRVNGGTIGLADRIKHFKEYHGLLV
jgi:putative chitinase